VSGSARPPCAPSEATSSSFDWHATSCPSAFHVVPVRLEGPRGGCPLGSMGRDLRTDPLIRPATLLPSPGNRGEPGPTVWRAGRWDESSAQVSGGQVQGPNCVTRSSVHDSSGARRLVHKARRLPARLRSSPGGLWRLARSLQRDPVETLRYVPEVVAHQLFDRQVAYQVEEDWGRPFHRALGVEWPCSECGGYRRVRARIETELQDKGLTVGRWTYGEYSDADASLCAAIWCAVRHLRPTRVVETGVARGVTSRVILEAMSANHHGHLWSVDLPHPLRPELHPETAAAVAESCRDRWTYLRGSSRRRLPSLVTQLGQMDLFVHDSLHTGRNMRFEMGTVWPALCPGGLMLVDDVDNQALAGFLDQAGRPQSLVFRSADGPWMFGMVQKPPGSSGP